MHLEDSRSCLEPSGAVVRPSGALLGSPEASRGLLERSWSRLGASWNGLGDVWKPLGALLEPSWGLLERSWSRLKASWAPLGAVLGPHGAVLGLQTQQGSKKHIILDPKMGPEINLKSRPVNLWNLCSRLGASLVFLDFSDVKIVLNIYQKSCVKSSPRGLRGKSMTVNRFLIFEFLNFKNLFCESRAKFQYWIFGLYQRFQWLNLWIIERFKDSSIQRFKGS